MYCKLFLSIDNSVRRLLLLKIVLHSLRPNSAYADPFWLISGRSICIKHLFIIQDGINFSGKWIPGHTSVLNIKVFGFSLYLDTFGASILNHFKLLCVVGDHWVWRGFGARNAHVVHIVNLIRFKIVYIWVEVSFCICCNVKIQKKSRNRSAYGCYFRQ